MWTVISFTWPGPPGGEGLADNRKHALAFTHSLRPSADRRSNDQYFERNCVPCAEELDADGKMVAGELLGREPLGGCYRRRMMPPKLNCMCCSWPFMIRMQLQFEGLSDVLHGLKLELMEQLVALWAGGEEHVSAPRRKEVEFGLDIAFKALVVLLLLLCVRFSRCLPSRLRRRRGGAKPGSPPAPGDARHSKL